MPSSTIHNVAFHYQERGRGEPVVLVHGFPFDSRMWDAQISSLSDRYRVIAPDLRGFGKSRSSQPFTINSLAEDLHALLETIGALPCWMAGLSMGGYVALAYSRLFAADLRGLALVDTRAEADNSTAREGRETMIRLAAEQGAAGVGEAMLPKLISPQTAEHRQDVRHRLKKMIEDQDSLTLQHALAAMRDRDDQCDHLASIAVPTAIIVGQDDAITPPTMAQEMQRAIPHAKMSVIPRAGHMSPVEAAEDVTRALRGWLKGEG